MKTEKVVKDKIIELMKKYHSRKRNTSEWIATTYAMQALRWVVDDIQKMSIEYLLE